MLTIYSISFLSFEELKTYNPELLDKNYIIAISKCDLLDNELQEIEALAKTTFPDEDVMFISSVSQKGLTSLKDRLWDSLNSICLFWAVLLSVQRPPNELFPLTPFGDEQKQ